MKGSGIIYVGYDFSDGKDVSVINVMQQDEKGFMRIRNVFLGADAERLYNTLVKKEKNHEFYKRRS